MTQILEEQLKYVNTMFNRYIRQKEIIIDYNNHLKSIISVLNERIIELTNQKSATEEELSKCQLSIEKEIKNIKNHKEEIENLQRLITEKENKINQLKSDIKEKDQDINDKEKAIKAYKSKIDDLMNDPSVLNAMNNKQTDVDITKEAFQKEKDNFELEIRVKQKIIAEKDEKIAKLTRYIAKLKNDNKSLEIKMESEINNEKAKLKELDFLEEKLKEKDGIIEDKQDQVKYLRELIDDYRLQIKEVTENLEVQLRKVSKTYEDLLNQKDMIIEKQDENIASLIKSTEEMNKTNKTSMYSLEAQNKKYQKLIDKLEEKL